MKTAVLLFIVSFTFFGCGEALTSKKVRNLNALQKNFEQFNVIDGLRLSTPGECDLGRSTKILNSEPSQEVESTLESCQVLYSCSDSAKAAIKTWNIQRLTFGLGKAPFNRVQHISGFSEKTNGIYFADTHRIYIDQNISTTYETCAVLLHEISHRADSNITLKTDPSLETEFPAYYLEQSFAGELALKLKDQKLNETNFKLSALYLGITRDSLFQTISEIVMPSSQTLKVTDFSKFAWE